MAIYFKETLENNSLFLKNKTNVRTEMFENNFKEQGRS